ILRRRPSRSRPVPVRIRSTSTLAVAVGRVNVAAPAWEPGRGSCEMPFPSLPSQGAPPARSQYVYETLRQAIISGTLAPGERLLEREICGQLQVSRTPVRWALLRLQAAKLGTEIPG